MNHLLAEEVGVDAGVILVCDVNYIERWGGEPVDAQVLDVKPGRYRIRWYIKESWNGEISGYGNVSVPSGRLFVGDPCYSIPDEKWDAFLQHTNWCGQPDKGTFFIDEMGGDGRFDVELSLE